MLTATAAQDRGLLRELLVRLGMLEREIGDGPHPGIYPWMLSARGAYLQLGEAGGAVWVTAMVPCDRCCSYHESGPIIDAGEVESFVAVHGGPCAR